MVWSHLLFVLPYVFLTLGDPFRALDARYARTALCLGARPNRVFWQVKLPMLLRPVLLALAVGFAVSVTQYLPTRSEEHTSELQSLMRNSYAVFCLKKKR